MKCYNHEYLDAVGVCTSCGIGVCRKCSFLFEGKLLCISCKEKMEKAKVVLSNEESSDNVKKLIDNFDYYLKLSEKAIGLDTSWREGVAEHIKVIDMIRKADNYEILIKSDHFLKAVHTTLRKWGLDQRRAKIKKFDDFKENIFKNINSITSLKDFKMEKLTDLDLIKDRVILLFNNLNVMKSNAKLVSVSKTLAHFLPDLIPPMDMENILYFFYGYKSLSINSEIKKFWEMLSKFHYIQKKTGLTLENHKFEGFNTSVPKMIDNAIWGFNYSKKLQEKNSKNNNLNSKLREESRPGIPVWMMITNVVKDMGKEFAGKDIADAVIKKYGYVNKGTIRDFIYLMTVNKESRINWSYNQKERLANSKYDLLFNNENNMFELYNPEKHGIWEIVKSENKFKINFKQLPHKIL